MGVDASNSALVNPELVLLTKFRKMPSRCLIERQVIWDEKGYRVVVYYLFGAIPIFKSVTILPTNSVTPN
jgi:hypothetical protein